MMTIDEWAIVVGVIVSAVAMLGPWMLMVHAKLAVVAARLTDLAAKVDHAAEANRELWSLCAQHQARLDTHDVQFSHVAQRLENIA